MKYLLKINIPEHLGIENKLKEALEVKAARGELEADIREWVLDFLTWDVPYTSVKVKVEDSNA